jgi:hypothetical protein
MKKTIIAFLSLVVLSSGAFAQNRPGSMDLERRVRNLENIVYDLSDRLARLESGGRPGPNPYPPTYPPAPPVQREVSCLVIADGYYSTFFAKGRTQIDAETSALQACGRAVNASFCKKARCEDNSGPLVNGAVCALTAKGYNSTYKGEGSSKMEAEYNARQACEKSINASFCNNGVDVRCETY